MTRGAELDLDLASNQHSSLLFVLFVFCYLRNMLVPLGEFDTDDDSGAASLQFGPGAAADRPFQVGRQNSGDTSPDSSIISLGKRARTPE